MDYPLHWPGKGIHFSDVGVIIPTKPFSVYYYAFMDFCKFDVTLNWGHFLFVSQTVYEECLKLDNETRNSIKLWIKDLNRCFPK